MYTQKQLLKGYCPYQLHPKLVEPFLSLLRNHWACIPIKELSTQFHTIPGIPIGEAHTQKGSENHWVLAARYLMGDQNC